MIKEDNVDNSEIYNLDIEGENISIIGTNESASIDSVIDRIDDIIDNEIVPLKNDYIQYIVMELYFIESEYIEEPTNTLYSEEETTNLSNLPSYDYLQNTINNSGTNSLTNIKEPPLEFVEEEINNELPPAQPYQAPRQEAINNEPTNNANYLMENTLVYPPPPPSPPSQYPEEPINNEPKNSATSLINNSEIFYNIN